MKTYYKSLKKEKVNRKIMWTKKIPTTITCNNRTKHECPQNDNWLQNHVIHVAMVRPKGNPQKYILEEQRVSENRSYKHKNIITTTETLKGNMVAKNK